MQDAALLNVEPAVRNDAVRGDDISADEQMASGSLGGLSDSADGQAGGK
jgi:hypothetical protein